MNPLHELNYHITIPWPKPPRFQSTDPNDELREWLESNVGKQKDTWNWNINYFNGELLDVWLSDSQLAVEFKLLFG